MQVFEVVSELAVVRPTGPNAAAAEENRQGLAHQLTSLLHKVRTCLLSRPCQG